VEKTDSLRTGSRAQRILARRPAAAVRRAAARQDRRDRYPAGLAMAGRLPLRDPGPAAEPEAPEPDAAGREPLARVLTVD
jgi:hypothetical protein